MFTMVDQLAKSVVGPLTIAQQQAFEKLDKLRVRLMLKAEKQCRKIKTVGIEFSPKIQQHRDRITLWTNVKSKKLGSKVSLSLLTRLEKSSVSRIPCLTR